MALGWINQMMAVLGEAEGEFVEPILNDIAKNYPQVLPSFSSLSYLLLLLRPIRSVLPFLLSYPQYLSFPLLGHLLLAVHLMA